MAMQPTSSPRPPSVSAGMPGKSYDTVDNGEFQDYSGYEWFKDAPPKQERPPPDPTYVPSQEVVDKNDHLKFAFEVAPNICWSKYKQYGQIGVLAWCSEFSEMIDMFKAFSLDGHLFVPTRRQALLCCSEILALDLDISIKLITMFMAQQIKRIRDFLDPNTVYQDWPSDFPFPEAF